MIVRAFTIKVPNSKIVTLSAKEKLLQLDPVGIICLVPSVICLVLALQWGGQQYAVGIRLVIALKIDETVEQENGASWYIKPLVENSISPVGVHESPSHVT